MALRGSKLTEEHKKKLSLARTGKKLPPFTEEHKRKISEALRGRKATDEQKRNLSISHLGIKQTKETIEKRCLSLRGRKMSDAVKREASERLKIKLSDEQTNELIDLYVNKLLPASDIGRIIGRAAGTVKRMLRDLNIQVRPMRFYKIGGRNRAVGLKRNDATRKKMSERARHGANSHLWRGGVSVENSKLRKSLPYKRWRRLVLKRDNYMCQECKLKKQDGVILHVDHIKPFALYPHLRLEVYNGRTLCEACHKKTDTYGSKINKYKEAV